MPQTSLRGLGQGGHESTTDSSIRARTGVQFPACGCVRLLAKPAAKAVLISGGICHLSSSYLDDEPHHKGG